MSDKGDPRAPWFPHSPALGEERIRHGTWKRTGSYDLGDLENDSLRRLDRQFRRELEDIEDGLANPKRRGYVQAGLDAIDLEVTLRVLLQRRYGASPHGTDSADEYFNGTPTPAPSYWLALVLDYRAFHLGEESVLEWSGMEEKYGLLAMLDFLALDGEVAIERARRAA